jgi:hypothetical protein
MTAMAMPTPRESFVGNALLLGRERRIKRLLDREQLIKALDRRGHAVALELMALDCRRTLALRRTLRHPGAPLLEMLVHRGRMLSLHAGVSVPLRLLRGGDFQCRLETGETGFDPLAEIHPRTLLEFPLRGLPAPAIGRGASGLGEHHRHGRGNAD